MVINNVIIDCHNDKNYGRNDNVKDDDEYYNQYHNNQNGNNHENNDGDIHVDNTKYVKMMMVIILTKYTQYTTAVLGIPSSLAFHY